ncbi:histidinol-phosphate transaminase [Amnimonas aquatica]|uniref:Histidinol-phosphate aminotransferase n=1 Tax=Amnimonas aquatica TaxID=2094561 RepID=A0A2P6AVH6_9GAMM|nr:histidinol-phosphate transaminase [Amnimonas aquatica]PQA52236.1 histidinol-phosphate transaminase [Amnimonas aquatica]
MTDFLSRARPGVQHLAPYQPGKPIEELQREFGLARVVKLASNENPLGPSPAALAALKAALQADPAELGRYPDGNGYVLKEAIRARFGWAHERILLGNGSNDVLELVARAFLGEGDDAIYAQHAFAVYPLAVQATGARGIEVPARNHGHDLPAMAAAVTPATKVIFLANPNNPTGTWFERADFEAFMAAVPANVVVVLDEAYCEFVDDAQALSGFDVLDRYPNLIVSRTLAKAYGLASLRVGYAVAGADLIGILNRVRQPFNVNSLALAAAAAAVADDDFVARSRALNAAGRRQWLDGLAALGLRAIPSRGNFLCVDMGQPAGPLFQALLREGVIVRPVANYGLPDHLRISIGLAEENDFALAALARVLAAAGQGAAVAEGAS